MNWLVWMPAAREKRIRDFIYRLTGLRPRREDVKPGAVVYVDERGWLAPSSPADGSRVVGVAISENMMRISGSIVFDKYPPAIPAKDIPSFLFDLDKAMTDGSVDLTVPQSTKSEEIRRQVGELKSSELPIEKRPELPMLPKGFFAAWDSVHNVWVAVRVTDRRRYAVMEDGELVPLDERED